MSDISNRGENKWKTINIDTDALDNIVPVIRSPLAIKIDTQGAEPYVIAGGEKILTNAELVIMEFTPYMMSRLGNNPDINLILY